MKKIIFILLCVTLCGSFFLPSHKSKTKPVIGIIVPMEHAALTEMIQGFSQKLEGATIKVFNAQADQTLQKSIIQQLIQENCDVLVPIGTQTSQMTIHLAKKQNVLCLAANTDILPSEPLPNITVLDDECLISKSFHLVHELLPKIKKIALIHSLTDKIHQDLASLDAIVSDFGIQIQKLPILTQSDLYSIGQAIESDCQAIFILKDHLVVSGIAALVKQAKEKNIPIISFDNGSVACGANLAVGIKEFDIGQEGAKIAMQILKGIPQNSSATLTSPLHLFLNENACLSNGMDIDFIYQKAQDLELIIEGKQP